MSDSRDQMIAELRQSVVPALRELGLRGSFPHFRRIRDPQIDLLSFQFNRHGGSFTVEVACCEPVGFTTSWGQHIPPNRVSAHDVHPDQRPRLHSSHEDRWFHYDPSSYSRAAIEVLSLLPAA